MGGFSNPLYSMDWFHADRAYHGCESYGQGGQQPGITIRRATLSPEAIGLSGDAASAPITVDPIQQVVAEILKGALRKQSVNRDKA